MNSVCLVSSSLLGPTKNGGVGTAITYLACELEKGGFDVTILFNGGIQCETEKYWTDKYLDMGIKFVYLPTWVKENYSNSTVSDHNWWTWRSYWTYQFILNSKFDIAHFPETCGYAFHTIQARRTTDLLNDLKVIVTMHSSTEWLKEGMEQFHLEDGYEDRANLLYLKLNYAERYTCQYCDLLLAPSAHMFKWAINRGWSLCENRKVAFNAYSSSIAGADTKDIDYNHFIFFGRLEKCKGIDIFCAAVNELAKRVDSDKEIKISFLGRNASVDGMLATEYIETNLNADIEREVHTEFDTFQAMEYIKSTGGVCVMSSNLDNSPYAIVECIENGIPFICSNTGGIPELVNENVLFDTNIESLLEKMISIRLVDFKKLEHKYSYIEANSNLVKIHKDILNINESKTSMESKLVSICIAYKNQSIFIYDLLDAIFSNTYKNIEIIIAEEEEKLKRDRIGKINLCNVPIKYVYNCGHTKGAAYNLCVENACGEYLLFINPEDTMQRDYIETLVKACQKASLNAAATLSKIIYGIGNVDLKENTHNMIMIPFGMNMELALFENTYSQSSFIVEKNAFEKTNGFREMNEAGIEWEFFNQLCSNGMKTDVVPVVGFRERDIIPKLINIMCYSKKISYQSHKYAVEPLLKEMPKYMRFFFEEWAFGRYYKEVLTKDRKSRFKYEAIDKKDFIDIHTHNLQIKNLNDRISGLNRQIKLLTQQRDNCVLGMANYENSFFWKISSPIRKILDLLRRSKK